MTKMGAEHKAHQGIPLTQLTRRTSPALRAAADEDIAVGDTSAVMEARLALTREH